MSIIEEIRERMERYPTARIEWDDSSIAYLPSEKDGFVVRLIALQATPPERYSVYYNGSHEEFTHRVMAIDAFAFGLSTACRLQEYSHDGKAYCWVVEVWDWTKQKWRADWKIIDPICAVTLFHGSPITRCLQNRVIDLNDGSDRV